jgi:hypothetical protein
MERLHKRLCAICEKRLISGQGDVQGTKLMEEPAAAWLATIKI